MILRGDYSFTAPEGSPEGVHCSCENQFDPPCPYRNVVGVTPDFPFSRIIINDWNAPNTDSINKSARIKGKRDVWCPLWKRERMMHIGAGTFTSMSLRDFSFARNPPIVAPHLPFLNHTLLYVSWGLWLDMKIPSAALDDQWGPSIDSVTRSLKHNKLTVVCGLVPACGLHKNVNYLSTQNNDNVLAYNDAVTRWCKQKGYHVFDTYTLTLNVEGLDGIDYTPWANVHIGMALFNFLLRTEPEAEEGLF